MKNVMKFVFLLAIVALPAGLLGASDKPDKNDPAKNKPKPAHVKKDKSVPEPSVLLLLGAAAGVAGARKLWQNGR